MDPWQGWMGCCEAKGDGCGHRVSFGVGGKQCLSPMSPWEHVYKLERWRCLLVRPTLVCARLAYERLLSLSQVLKQACSSF